jgi:hypothetical protein
MTALEASPRSAYCYIPLQLPVAYVNKRKALVAGRGYHVVITANIPANRPARWLERTMLKGNGNNSRETWGDRSMGLLFVGPVYSVFGPLLSLQLASQLVGQLLS